MAKDQDEADREFRRDKVRATAVRALEDAWAGYVRAPKFPDGDALYEEDATLP